MSFGNINNYDKKVILLFISLLAPKESFAFGGLISNT